MFIYTAKLRCSQSTRTMIAGKCNWQTGGLKISGKWALLPPDQPLQISGEEQSEPLFSYSIVQVPKIVPFIIVLTKQKFRPYYGHVLYLLNHVLSLERLVRLTL